MIKFGIYLLYAFVACNLYGMAYSQNHTNSVCILEDAPSQCGAFCLSAQRPFIDHNYKVQRQMDSISEILNEIQKRLDRIEEAILARQTESPSNFERNLQDAQTSQKENQAKMERIANGLLVTEANIERIQRETQATMDRIEKGTLETQETIFQEVKSISMGFQWIESRYFYIENNFKQTWIDAEDTCRKMGGHLAAFQNQKEFNAVTAKLHHNIAYWLGISDREKEGEFVTASGNPPTFLTWNRGEPNNAGGKEDCVNIWNGKINDVPCEFQRHYICQSDNKV
uniref:Hepatic lectin-like n=1 Tax=Drosophila rhopaloa TaxID=1041015 RepID=A0A6P4FJZ5_DRORH